MTQPLAIAKQHRDKILTDIESGRYLKDIAAELGVSASAISQLIANDPEYRAARETGAETRLEQYQSGIDTADDGLKLARAREGFRAQSWRCQAEFARWAPKSGTQVNIAAAGDMQVQIVSFADVQQSQRTIENAADGSNSSVMLNEKQADGT